MLEIRNDKVLKEFTEDHLYNPLYFNWLRDVDIVKSIYRIDYLIPLQFSEVEAYVHSLFKSKNDALFAIYYSPENKFIGTLKVGHINWRSGLADIGIMIGDKSYHGKGLSKEVIYLACKYCFEVLSLRKITAGTPEFNIPMIKCFEKIGFKEEGNLKRQLLIGGKYENHILFGLFKENIITP